MIHVWKINEDLYLNKEDIERTFSGFSDALLLGAGGGTGRLTGRTSRGRRGSMWRQQSLAARGANPPLCGRQKLHQRSIRCCGMKKERRNGKGRPSILIHEKQD